MSIANRCGNGLVFGDYPHSKGLDFMHFELPWQDRDAFCFDGELIVRVETDRDETESGWRGYDLSVYSREDEGFVGVIDFLTTVEGETQQSLIESMDAYKDVEDFFFAFEPSELIDPVLGMSLMDEDRQALLHRLYAHYDTCVSAVLEQVRAIFPATVNEDS